MDPEPQAVEETAAPVKDDLNAKLAANRERYQSSLNELAANITETEARLQQQKVMVERLRGAIAATTELLTPEEAGG